MYVFLCYMLSLLGTTVFLRNVSFWKLFIERLEMFEPRVSHNIQIIDFLKIKVLNFNFTALTLRGLHIDADQNKHCKLEKRLKIKPKNGEIGDIGGRCPDWPFQRGKVIFFQ